MNKSASVFVAGHRGLAGSALVRRLEAAGYDNVITQSRASLDLRDHAAVERFFLTTKPQYVFLAAATVGGIHANNTRPADFIRDNLLIQSNVIDAAYRHGAQKLLFLGSSCIYPRLAPQPMKEEYLLTGELEPTNQWYAIAKIAGLKMCQAYRRQYGFDAISVMPTNLYGPNDNFNLENSHVLPALIRKFHEARVSGSPQVVVWGSGAPRREFLHVDDFADAACMVMERYSEEPPINIGCGEDVSIAEIVEMVREAVGYEGEIVYDRDKPDGTPRKLLDISKLKALGWAPQIQLGLGIAATYDWLHLHWDEVRK